MKIGDKIVYRDKKWTIEMIYRSFIIVTNGKLTKEIYKDFWDQIKVLE